MGKPDALDRLVQIMIALVSLFSLVNGAMTAATVRALRAKC